VTLAAIAIVATPERVHARPERPAFSGFPLELNQWHGYPGRLDAEYLDVLKLDDYLLADYFDSEQRAVNLYASYYAIQANGNSAHSPKACIPGDGWEIHSFDSHAMPGVKWDSGPVIVNRVLVQKGEHRSLVYYWFQQRGRIVTGEYTVKLYIFLDSLMRQRSDGAMVRLVTALSPSETLADADARLEAFAATAMPELRRFIPE
jgi:EpsI family protein